MSRIRSPFSIRFSPVAIAAAVVLLGSTAVASAQYYDQGPSYSHGAPQDQYAQTDPPDRAARLAYISGDVEFAPAGESDWGSADINRPMVTGDRLLTGDDGRAALELGDAALRINHDSAFNFLDLDDTTTQVELSQGTLNLRVRRLRDGQTYEIDTPTVAFIAGEPGTYRVDVAPDGNGAMVTVFEGSGTVYGENGTSRPVQAGQSYRFDDSALTRVAARGLPAPDDFDRFCGERDSRYANSVSRRYVSEDMVGYDDLDRYGDWRDTPDYGAVWYPTRVATGWAPYRDGHWAWIEPWGWTWVDDEPWGYAPFHYGRWVYVRNRWGWMPGPRTVRPVYAPALVAFVGGSGFSISIGVGGGGYGQPVGWFPLGPRDVYVPPYRASRNYFTNINVTNIRNVYVNKTVINNYYGNYAAGRPYAGAREYAYRNNPRAFTAVPRNVFASAKPIRPAVLRVKPNALARATVAPIPHVAPTRASLAIKPPKRPIAKPVARAFDRTVIARHAPPPRPVPFAAREKVIAKQGGAPIPVAQLQKMRQQHAKAQPERVRVVAPATKPGTPARPGQQVVAPRQQPPAPQEQRKGERPPARASIHPIQVPVNPPKGASRNAPRQEPQRPGELPSARFAHPQRGAAPTAEQRAAQNQQRSEQQRANRQQQAEQAQQRTGQERANRQQQQAQQEQQRADQARQRAEQQRTNRQQQQAQQAQQRTGQERANRQQQQAQQEQQRADQARQRAEQQRTNRQQQQAQQAQQRAEQERASRQRQQAQQEQQRADQARQRAEQQRANRQQQQARQAQQRAEQERANRQRQQEQQSARQAQQRQAQMQQQREAQGRAQEQQRASQARTQQQRQQHAPPPQRQQEQKKKKNHDQQDDGGH